MSSSIKKKDKKVKSATVAAVEQELEQQTQVVEISAINFDGMKKRKKKKNVNESEALDASSITTPVVDAPVAVPIVETPAPVVPAEEASLTPAADEEFTAMFGAKKKKKKTPKVFEEFESAITDENAESPVTLVPASADSEAPTADSAPAPAGEFDFGEKKKKKKKRPDLAEFEAQLREEGGVGVDEGNTDENAGGPAFGGSKETEPQEPWIGSTREYTYEELLKRVFKVIDKNNPNDGRGRITLPPPQVTREGTKKSAFANVVDIARRLRREPDHLIQYLFSELGTTGSIDGGQRLIIKGRFQSLQIEKVLKRYIAEYITCKTCKSGDTLLSKDNRLFFLQCQSCGSSKTVSAIKIGFVAQTQKRAAQRAATG